VVNKCEMECWKIHRPRMKISVFFWNNFCGGLWSISVCDHALEDPPVQFFSCMQRSVYGPCLYTHAHVTHKHIYSICSLSLSLPLPLLSLSLSLSLNPPPSPPYQCHLRQQAHFYRLKTKTRRSMEKICPPPVHTHTHTHTHTFHHSAKKIGRGGGWLRKRQR
jgi:hypothetical protein